MIEEYHFVKCVCTEKLLWGASHIVKAKKPSIIEELFLPAAKDMCQELLGEDGIQKAVCVHL